MRKELLIILFSILSVLVKSQVGINTLNPQGSLHVSNLDGTDNIVVLKNGNVGLGTLNPNARIEIHPEGKKPIRIKDGTQGNGKFLVSDGNGYASWVSFGLNTISADFYKSTSFSIETTEKNFVYTGTTLNLPPGKWLIVAFFLLSNSVYTPTPIYAKTTFAHNTSNKAIGSEVSPSEFITSSEYDGNNSYISGNWFGRFGLVQGYLKINNNTLTNKIYELCVGKCYYDQSIPGVPQTITYFGQGIWLEDSLTAISISY